MFKIIFVHLKFCRQGFTFTLHCLTPPVSWQECQVSSVMTMMMMIPGDVWRAQALRRRPRPDRRPCPGHWGMCSWHVSRVTCPRSRQTRRHDIRLSVSGGCLSTGSTVSILLWLLQCDCCSLCPLQWALQETAWAGPRSSWPGPEN